MAVHSAHEVFSEHLPQRLRDKADLVAQIKCRYKFVITGEQGGTWVVDLTQPGGAIVAQAEEVAADCTITCSSKDFLDIIQGRANPQMAVMTGKLKIAGDFGLLFSLASLLS